MNRIATQLGCRVSFVLVALVVGLVLLVGLGWPGLADAAPPPAVEGVELDERLGERVPGDVELTDHLGRSVTLEQLLDGEHPVILLLAYYRCPMLCGLTINGVAQGLNDLGWTPGEEFRVVTVSFDPRDGAPDAERARAKALDSLDLEVDEQAWPFLAGDEREVRRLADSLGFHYAYDERTDQYAHPSAVFVLTPRGVLSRVLFGFEYPALDLRMALVEAGEGKVGSMVDQVLVTCYRYDPTQRRYGFWVFGFLRLAGLLLLIIAGTGLFVLIRRDRGRTRAHAARERGP
jgi:protein SCO1/2